MFLAIINDTYSDVKADIDLQKSEVDLGIFFKERYDKVIQKMSLKRDKIMDIQKAMLTADKDNDKKLDFEEWRTELRVTHLSLAFIDCIAY
jgi:polycystin 2